MKKSYPKEEKCKLCGKAELVKYMKNGLCFNCYYANLISTKGEN